MSEIVASVGDAVPVGGILPAGGVPGGDAGHPAVGGASSRWWGRLLGQWGFRIALGWIVVLAVVAVFAPLVASHSPTTQDLFHRFAGPSGRHWFGTDDLGRDVFSRLVYGTRVSMRVSFEVVGLAFVVAIPIGLFAGYRGGQVDNVLMRLMDGGLSFPPLVLALAVVAVLGPGINNAALALAVVFVPSFARLVRGQALAIKAEPFVEASQSLGTPAAVIAVRRVLPNVLPAVIVQTSLALGGALLAEAALSFLGLGEQPPAPSWGSMLQEAYNTGLFTHPWGLVVPGAAIALAVLAFNTLGDGLSAAMGVTRARVPLLRRGARGTSRRGLTTVDVGGGSEILVASPGGAPACLVVDGLTVHVATSAGTAAVVEDVSFVVDEGETLGLVGESGSGKTVTSLAIMRLLPSPSFTITGGRVWLGGKDLLALDLAGMRKVRGGEVAMIFQDPLTSLNPARTVGAQLSEAVRLHQPLARGAARREAVELLDRVGIPDPRSRAKSFPHQLSGGMRQRVMIAMALAGRPKLLIADEPTTALDVTVQAQVLDLLRDLSRTERLAVVFVTHDLGVVAELCDRVAVMYAGQLVEQAATSALFSAPLHPYTAGLMGASRAAAGNRQPIPIQGQVPAVGEVPQGCRFHPRCSHVVARCTEVAPPLDAAVRGADATSRTCRCWRRDELDFEGVV